MRILAALLMGLLLALPVPGAAMAAADKDEKVAADAARSWVALIDAGDYAQSWKDASPFFRDHVTADKWAAAAQAARAPMGSLVSRGLTSITFTKVLFGMPDGDYALVVFDTKFANKAHAAETMAMIMDQGRWKPIGYHLR